MQVPAAAWREWAGSDAFLLPLRRRLQDIGLTRRAVNARDRSRIVRPELAWSRGRRRRHADDRIAAVDWRVIATPGIDHAHCSHRARRRRLTQHFHRRTVLVGSQLTSRRGASGDADAARSSFGERQGTRVTILWNREAPTTSQQPRRSLQNSPRHSTSRRRVLSTLCGTLSPNDGILGPAVAMLALSLAVVGVVFEAVLLRSALDMGTLLHAPEQRLWAGATLVGFAAILLGLEFVLASAERRMGAHLESRLRAMFLDKIPRLADAYFQSRPVADMLERSHTLHTLRTLPRLGLRFSRVGLELLVTALAIAWLSPQTAMLAGLAAVAAAAIPLMAQASVVRTRPAGPHTHRRPRSFSPRRAARPNHDRSPWRPSHDRARA